MINLLPAPARERLRQEQRLRLVIILGTVVFISLVAFSLFLALIRVALDVQRSNLAIEISLFQQESTKEDSTLGEIKRWNENLNRVEQFKKERREVSAVLSQLTQSLAPELSLLSLSYTPQKKTVKKEETIVVPAAVAVSGKAPTRELLFQFRETLLANPFFTELNFPPSNWVNPVTITFSFQAKLAKPQ